MKGEGQRNPPGTGETASLEASGERQIDAAKRGQESAQPQGSRVERDINLNSDDSFPASDPPSWSPTTAGSPCPDGVDCDE